MIDFNNFKSLSRERLHRRKTKVTTFQASRLASKLARTYTDDIDGSGRSAKHLASQFMWPRREDDIDCRRFITVSAR